MKNAKFITFFLFLMLLLTGCKSKNLNCIKENKLNYGTVKEEQAFVFKNDKINLYKANVNVSLNDKYKEYAKVLFESFEDPFKDLKDKKNITYKIEKKKNKLSINIIANYKELDKMTKQSLNISKNTSFEKLKNSFKQDGYKCE